MRNIVSAGRTDVYAVVAPKGVRGSPDVAGIRARLGKTQEEMASLVGVTLRTVSRWEAGSSKPSRLSVKRIGEILAREMRHGK